MKKHWIQKLLNRYEKRNKRVLARFLKDVEQGKTTGEALKIPQLQDILKS